MNEKAVLTEVEELRDRQSCLLSTFEEIAQTFLNLACGERGCGKVCPAFQEYLDGAVSMNGACCRRRAILLAIHDLDEDLEAPAALQSKTLAKLELLHIQPAPRAALYQDIATAILRMEVAIRSESMQALDVPASDASAQPPLRSEAMQAPDEPASGASAQPLQIPARKRRRSMATLKALGYGAAAAACCAGAFIILGNEPVDVPYARASAEGAAKGVETFAVPCASSGEVGSKFDGKTCALGSPPHNLINDPGDGVSAAEIAINAPPVRQSANQALWATSVEAN